MRASNKQTNPFYVLLLLAGCAFAITAFAYGVMTVRELRLARLPSNVAETSRQAPGNAHFSSVLDTYGPRLMLAELVVLAVGTFGAMALDHYRQRATDSAASQKDSEFSSEPSPDLFESPEK